MRSVRFDLEFRVRSARLPNGTLLVSVGGELDLHTLPQLEAALEELDGDPAAHLIVDLTDVTFLDSTTLGALVREARARAVHGQSLVLVCDNRSTLRTLEITGVLPFFHIERTLHDAVRDAFAASYGR